VVLPVTNDLLIESVSHRPSQLHSMMRWIALLPVEIIGAWLIWKWHKDAHSRFNLVFLTGALSYTTLLAFWPLREGQTFLPIFPVLAISVAPALLWLGAFISRWIRWISVPVLIVIAEIAFICVRQPPFIDKTINDTQMIRDVLKLTDANDYVMDSKGETIYRRRPYYYIVDKLTKGMIDRGLVRDDIPQRVIETRTPVITTEPRTSKQDIAFMENNYLSIGSRLGVLGKIIRPRDASENQATRFEVTVPNRYLLVSESGQINGVLDDTPLNGPRELAVGDHVFHSTTTNTGTIALVWAQAIDRGYSPFSALRAH